MTAGVRSFEDFFKMGRSEVPEPQRIPRGHYIVVCRGVNKRPPKTEDKSGLISFGYEPYQPTDDVDPDELAALGENYSIRDDRAWSDHWLKDARDLKGVFAHIELHGVDTSEGDLGELLKKVVNKRLVAYLEPEDYMHPVKGPQFKIKISGFKALQ